MSSNNDLERDKFIKGFNSCQITENDNTESEGKGSAIMTMRLVDPSDSVFCNLLVSLASSEQKILTIYIISEGSILGVKFVLILVPHANNDLTFDSMVFNFFFLR